MASRSGSRKSSGGQRKKTTSGTKNRSQSQQYTAQDSAMFHEISLIILFALAAILFLCNFGVIGAVGNTISGIMFGMFGLLAYVTPVLAFLAIAFGSINPGNPAAKRKIIAGVILFFLIGILFEFISGSMGSMQEYNVGEIYQNCSEGRKGGGVLSGSLAYLLYHFLDMLGAVLVVLVLMVICLVLLTERSLISGMKSGSRRVVELGREDAKRRRELAEERRRNQEEQRKAREEERRIREEEKENEKILRMDKKVTGVTIDTALHAVKEKETERDDIHEIMIEDTDEAVERVQIGNHSELTEEEIRMEDSEFDFSRIRIHSEAQEISEVEAYGEDSYEEDLYGGAFHRQDEYIQKTEYPLEEVFTEEQAAVREVMEPARRRPAARLKQEETVHQQQSIPPERQNAAGQVPKKYKFPPLSCLIKGAAKSKDSTRELNETALHLQQTLSTFGVRVTITDISQGPSVTRYELQPEQGVKVSKIVGLTDDIKLNLAATDIRIEAPIPGKAAVGIEVPNKENTAVALRDLLESKEFKDFPSNIAFAVGKDIAGKTVVSDIAKMPHMLIAGATGSGKSVCINTLIMSILYKAHPDDVKLIMVDPKVVELSVYNGIPHLLIPVVTDPKKAAAALHWGVAEMEDRYKKFADFNVRDLKGYNKKVEALREKDPDAPAKMPQIVIIVDELADLMMVAPGEVEESICRLAQLARAAGIHLIIATQRPSVDVITGLIKANMPSRVAFAVSSGVDSRTILDMNGAEKLLGKGDMLFYPQGYSKPARVQGAFVSDKEVSDVVDFLKNQMLGNTYAEEIEEKIQNLGSVASGGGPMSDGADERDTYFADAGKFIIEKEKASIGMLQRVFKIGFNRAARIMDQLCDYGVVGEEEGTKPRKVLMSMEEFEQLLEEI